MAYRLKTIGYQSQRRKILLQNENGPCPLLAIANALLLKGVISLPSECVRNGVAAIDDVIHMLAERALKQSSNIPELQQHQHQQKHGEPFHNAPHQLDELLSLFPKLQYGMDVNPKFTAGPTGVEYTMNLTAFDLLGVELVHGWLLDPQEEQTFSLVDGKSYNQLIEMVVHGNEDATKVEQLTQEIYEKEQVLVRSEAVSLTKNTMPSVSTGEGDESHAAAAAESAAETEAETAGEASETVLGTGDTEDTVADTAETEESAMETVEAGWTVVETAVAVETAATLAAAAADLEKLHKEKQRASESASEGAILNSFLSATSHQLTYHGLHELHNYLSEETLCVFFRNNHFATMTKKSGILYLLVTDLGYSNVEEVVWEKLDAIDGDTEYANEWFAKPEPRAELAPASGPTLSPEEMLAQRGQTNADYELALRLSRGGDVSRNNLAEEEGRLVAAATEASLREWNNQEAIPTGGTYFTNIDEAKEEVTETDEAAATDAVVMGVSYGNLATNGVSPAVEEPVIAVAEPLVPSGVPPTNALSGEDLDQELARQLQAMMFESDKQTDHLAEQSEHLARSLQDEELRKARNRSIPTSNTARQSCQSAPKASSSGDGKNCIIS